MSLQMWKRLWNVFKMLCNTENNIRLTWYRCLTKMFSSNTLTMPLKHTMQDVSLMLFHVFCGVSRKRLINVRNMLSYYVLQGIFAQHLPKYFDDINKRFYYICDMLMELMFCFFYQQYVVITSFGSGFNKF